MTLPHICGTPNAVCDCSCYQYEENNQTTPTPSTLKKLLDNITYEPGDNDPQHKQREEGYAHVNAWEADKEDLKQAYMDATNLRGHLSFSEQALRRAETRLAKARNAISLDGAGRLATVDEKAFLAALTSDEIKDEECECCSVAHMISSHFPKVYCQLCHHPYRRADGSTLSLSPDLVARAVDTPPDPLTGLANANK